MTRRDYRRISVFIHGWWGAGKSWLAQTAPGPRLVIDTEGGVYDAPGNHVEWHPRQPFPEGLDKDSSVIVDVQEWGDFADVMSILRSGDHPFESLVIDSLHELQDQLKRTVADPGEEYDPNATFQHQAWGRLKNNLGLAMRELRDFTRPRSNKRINVIIVCGSDDEGIKARPLLEGGIRKNTAGFYDLVGYLRTAQDQHGDEIRVLQIQPSETAVAKCRLHNVSVKHGTQIVNPDIRKILRVVNTDQKEAA